MTRANRQTTAQSTAHFGAKATGKLTAKPTAKPEPVKTRRITPAELTAALEATREKDQPVLDYLKDK
ncbi:MAG: hypothetical protein ACNYPD_05755 [Candidatus Halichondribacter symbioticus]